jgi:hypothetical protein
MKKLPIFVLFLLASGSIWARPDTLIYGYGITLRVGLGQKGCSEFGVAVTAGIGKSVGEHALFTYQITSNIYRGGLGNSLLPSLQNDVQCDIVNSFGVTGGWGRQTQDRFIHHWSVNQPAAMRTPFVNSATMATNFIWNNHQRSQQVGFMGLQLGRTNLGYYNDGPPFQLNGTGDGYDRWWTGGGYVQVYLPDNQMVVAYFDKFTGFQPNAYEIANAVRLNNVMYRDIERMTFNRGRIGLGYQHTSGMSLHAAVHNRFDVQDFIHRLLKYPYHPNAYTPRLIVGPQYFYTGTPKF